MVTSKGRDAVARYLKEVPAELERKVLLGAARAAGNVVADEAKLRSRSDVVDDNIVVKVRRGDGRIVVRITVKPGWARSIGIWLEYGTDPHFISVDEEQREGRTATRINRLDTAAKKDGRSGPGGSLVIGGSFVGGTVHHPGATPHPFLRPALDLKEREAIAAAQGYINARVTRAGIIGEPQSEDSE